VSETDLVSSDAAAPAAPRKRGGLTGMVLAELRQLAAELNISGTAGMRKGDLIAAIRERQASGGSGKATATQLPLPEGPAEPVVAVPAQAAAPTAVNGAGVDAPPVTPPAEVPAAEAPAKPRRRRAASRPAGAPAARSAAERARALAPARPEGHLALGDWFAYVAKDDARALEQYARGHRLAPPR